MSMLTELVTDYTLRTVALGSAALGLVAGALGAFAVLRRQSLLGDAVSHAALPGIVLAFMVTGTKTPFVLVLGAAVAGWASAVAADHGAPENPFYLAEQGMMQLTAAAVRSPDKYREKMEELEKEVPAEKLKAVTKKKASHTFAKPIDIPVEMILEIDEEYRKVGRSMPSQLMALKEKDSPIPEESAGDNDG